MSFVAARVRDATGVSADFVCCTLGAGGTFCTLGTDGTFCTLGTDGRFAGAAGAVVGTCTLGDCPPFLSSASCTIARPRSYAVVWRRGDRRSNSIGGCLLAIVRGVGLD